MGRTSTWTKKELSFLRKNWMSKSCKEIAQALLKDERACYYKARQLKLRKRPGYTVTKSKTSSIVSQRARVLRENIKAPRWTVSDVAFLRSNIGKMTDEEIAKHLGKTVPAIYCKKRSLKKVKNMRPIPDIIKKSVENKRFKAWTKEEESFLKKHYTTDSLESIAKHLGRTEDAVKTRAYTLGLINNGESRLKNKWTRDEVKYLKKNINKKSYEQMGEYLGRSSAAIASKVSSLNIEKPYIKKSKRSFPLARIMAGLSIALNISLITYIVLNLIK